jgi:hypothetical protein
MASARFCQEPVPVMDAHHQRIDRIAAQSQGRGPSAQDKSSFGSPRGHLKELRRNEPPWLSNGFRIELQVCDTHMPQPGRNGRVVGSSG